MSSLEICIPLSCFFPSGNQTRSLISSHRDVWRNPREKPAGSGEEGFPHCTVLASWCWGATKMRPCCPLVSSCRNYAGSDIFRGAANIYGTHHIHDLTSYNVLKVCPLFPPQKKEIIGMSCDRGVSWRYGSNHIAIYKCVKSTRCIQMYIGLYAKPCFGKKKPFTLSLSSSQHHCEISTTLILRMKII